MNKKVKAIIEEYRATPDELGSYTGNPEEGYRPEQDADDL